MCSATRPLPDWFWRGDTDLRCLQQALKQTLDLGYAQIPLPGKAVLRVGRQEANWNNGLLVSDDRRDRILGIVPTSVGTVLALYDRRGDQKGFFANDNGDMTALGMITKLGGFQTGALWVH